MKTLLRVLPKCAVDVVSLKLDFIMSISQSVNLLCLNISGYVSDNNNVNDHSCLTSSNITAKYCSI